MTVKRNVATSGMLLFATLMLCSGPVVGFAGQSAVEKLLSVAPDDALVIVGTSGGDEMGPAFKETVIGKMWADQQTQAFYTQIRDTLIGKIRSESSPKDFNEISAIADSALFLFSRPRIVVAAGRQAGPGEFPAYLSVIVNAGPVKEEFAARIKKIEGIADWGDIKDATFAGCKMRAIMPPGYPPVYWGMQGDYFVFAVNDPNGFALKHLKGGGSSSSSCLSKVAPNGDAFSMYADVTRIKAVFQLDKSKDEKMRKVNTLLTSLGLDNVKEYVMRTGFVGGQFVTEAFLIAPEPRKGVLAAIKPLDMKVFDSIDPNCISASAMNIDTAVIFDSIMATIKNMDEGGYKKVTDGLAEFETKANFKIRDGIIASLAGPVNFYSLPSGPMDMSFGGGAVVIADLKDQVKFEQNMATLGAYIVKESNGSLQISVQTIGDRKLNVWTIPQMAMVGFVPTWTVVNGKLVFATSQQSCKAAADRVASPVAAKSLSALPQFRQVTTNLPKGLTHVSYLDSTVYFKMLMGQLQRVWPMATMGAAQAGVSLPYVLPDLSQYADQMKPGVAYSWSDKDGIHKYIKGSGVEQAIGGVAAGAMGAAVLMPALAKAKEKAKDVSSMNNLRQIGLSMMVYADDHKGAYPKELADLVKDASLSPKALECNRKPKDFTGPGYVYVAGLTSKAPALATSVLAYENPGFCNNGKLYVLYGDAHVEMVDKVRFRADLKKTYETLGQPVQTFNFGKKAANG
jgi:hypothetical protein